MSLSKLANYINLEVPQDKPLSFKVLVRELTRLAEVTEDDLRQIEINLTIREHVNAYLLDIHLLAELVMVCQRCMRQIAFPINSKVCLAVSEGEEEILGYDLYKVDSLRKVPLKLILEDELLLSLPVVVNHTENCVDKRFWQVGEIEDKNNSFTDITD